MQITLSGQSQQLGESKISVEEKVQVTAQEQKQVLEAISDWAGELHRQLSEESDESLCFSPTSITAVLGMIIRGMHEGASKDVVLQALNLADIPQDRLHAILGSLFEVEFEGATVEIANAVGVNGEIKETYLESVKEDYDAQVFPLGHNAAEQINKWVAEKTYDKITEIISPNADLSQLKAALMNAIYFKGQWENPFDKERSYKQPFKCANGLDVERMMMHDNGFYDYFNGVGYSMLEKKFNGGISFVAFLPNQVDGLKALEKELSASFIESSRQGAGKKQVIVTLPKLDINFGVDTLLLTLEKMGFDFREELSEMADLAVVSQIIHKTCLKVDEEGAEGAAATAAIVTTCGMGPTPSVSVFDARHPFVYFIMAGDTILFQGTVKDEKCLVDE